MLKITVSTGLFISYQVFAVLGLDTSGNHGNLHEGWKSSSYYCKGITANSYALPQGGWDGQGASDLQAAVKGPNCGQSIWIKNCGLYGSSVNNAPTGKCITAKLVDEEGGGSVDMNWPAWNAVTANSASGQFCVEWGYENEGGGCGSPCVTNCNNPENSQSHRPTQALQYAGNSANYVDSSKGGSNTQPLSQEPAGSGGNGTDGTPSASGNQNCQTEIYKQCDGQGFNGCKQCAEGLQCTATGDPYGYSKCTPQNTGTGQSSTGTGTSPEDAAFSQPAGSKPSGSSSSGGDCPGQLEARCGGTAPGWTNGCNKCAQGLKCQYFNAGWSQCKDQSFQPSAGSSRAFRRSLL